MKPELVCKNKEKFNWYQTSSYKTKIQKMLATTTTTAFLNFRSAEVLKDAVQNMAKW